MRKFCSHQIPRLRDSKKGSIEVDEKLHTGVVDTFATKEKARKWTCPFGFVVDSNTRQRLYFRLDGYRELNKNKDALLPKLPDKAELPKSGDMILFEIGHNSKGPIGELWTFHTKVEGPRETMPIISSNTKSVVT